MKRYVQDMTPEERRAWREWQAWWTCLYAVVIGALIGIGTFIPRSDDTELAQSAPIVQPHAGERVEVPLHIGLK